MAVTIYDIARRAEVSIATVSRVFNAHPRVASSTRERVFELAREMGYQPHVSARCLARQNSHIISAVVPMMTSYFFMEVIRGVQDRLDASDFDLLVYASRTLTKVDGQINRAVENGRAEGVLVCSMPLTEERTAVLQESGTCTVLVDSFSEAFDSVSVDNQLGGRIATDHLLDLGYKRIAFIAGHPDSRPVADRYAGYLSALAGRGITEDSELVCFSDDAVQHGYTREAGFDSMQQLLALDEPPEAVFVASDVQALGAMKAARDAGLQLPEDISIVGFDDISTSAYVGLTTLRQPMYEMGKLATELLLRRIENPTATPSHTIFAPRLVVRETSSAGLEELEVGHA
ncbi:LacI family DNA-binding transcriptional regulator [soil metagenome]